MTKIMELTGLSATAAGTVLLFIDAASFIGLIISLTGIGVAAAAAVVAWRFAIKQTLATAGKAAAIIL